MGGAVSIGVSSNHSFCIKPLSKIESLPVIENELVNQVHNAKRTASIVHGDNSQLTSTQELQVLVRDISAKWENEQRALSNSQTLTQTTTTPQHVLLIQKHELSAKILKRYFDRAGYTVSHVSTFAMAKLEILHTTFDSIIIDLDDFDVRHYSKEISEFVQAVQQEKSYLRAPFILATTDAHLESRAMLEAGVLGFEQVVFKPFSVKDFEKSRRVGLKARYFARFHQTQDMQTR